MDPSKHSLCADPLLERPEHSGQHMPRACRQMGRYTPRAFRWGVLTDAQGLPGRGPTVYPRTVSHLFSTGRPPLGPSTPLYPQIDPISALEMVPLVATVGWVMQRYIISWTLDPTEGAYSPMQPMFLFAGFSSL